MNRLTTNDETSEIEFLNTFFCKENDVWIRNGRLSQEYADCSLLDWMKQAVKANGLYVDVNSEEEMSVIMYNFLQYGPNNIEGILGTLYLAAIISAEIRERLKSIEDILGNDYDLNNLRNLIESDQSGNMCSCEKVGRRTEITSTLAFTDQETGHTTVDAENEFFIKRFIKVT